MLPRKARLVLATVGMLVITSACTTINGPASSGVTLSEEPLLGKFVWHDLITDDVDAAREFYGELFGWTFETTTRPANDDPYTLIKSGEKYVGGIVQLDDPEDGTDYSRWLGYVSVEDVHIAASLTVEAGGNVLVQPFTVPGIGYVAGIQDPQGAVLGVIRSKVGDPSDDPEPGPGAVVWNELVADDAQTAAEFYESLTGLEQSNIERRGGTYTLLKSGPVARAGILQNPGSELLPNWITHFSVANPLATSATAIRAGGNILIEPSPEFREGTVALLTDPTGAIFMVQRM